MKTLLLATVLTIGIVTAAYANDVNKISFNVKENFKKDFTTAEQTVWNVKRDFIKASFIMDGERCEAFYNSEGNKIGMCRYISTDDLSLSAKRTIAKKYPGYEITEALEFSGNDEDAIYLYAVKDKEKVVVKINDYSSVSTFKKVRDN